MKISKSFQFDKVQGFKFGSSFYGKPRLFSHIYFIDGLLVDTGHSRMRKEITQQLSSLSVDQIFITHHHEDHTGNAQVLSQQFQCPTYASSLCAEVMRKPPKISFVQWMAWGNRPANFDLRPKDHFIETKKYLFEIIPIPGHALDMVALFEKNEGWLFSSDLFVSEYIKYFMRPESMLEQIESIKKVLELDFNVMFCGHNPQFKNGKQKLKNKLRFFENFYQKVAELNQKGYSVNAIIKEMKLKRSWKTRILSTGELSTANMVKSVIRDEKTIN